MLPTRLIRRYVTRLVFIIPVIWFSFFVLSFYFDDTDTENRDLSYNKRNIDRIQDTNLNEFNLENKQVKKLGNVNTVLNDKPKETNIQEKGRESIKLKVTIKEEKKEVDEKENVDTNEDPNRDAADEKGDDQQADVNDISEKSKDKKPVLAAPNHPEKPLIDPNAPGK